MAAVQVVTSDGVGNYTYSADQGAKRHADRLHAHQVEFGLFLPVWMAEPPARVVFPKPVALMRALLSKTNVFGLAWPSMSRVTVLIRYCAQQS
ncbi:hypothetical protein [Mesorhizobium sp. M0701]|uniref:hypothetical protein n=1 Tax=Mesorhizobium sp. M0701 TaxID=2956989 RepID=UPI0033375BC8